MKKVLIALLCGGCSLFGSTVLVTSPSQLNTTDVIDWSQFGSDQTNVNQNFFASTSTVVSGSSYSATVSGRLTNGSGIIKVPGTANGGIEATDALLSTTNGSGLSLSFGSTWGVGAYVDGVGAFVAHLQAFAGLNSVFDMSVKSNDFGDPLFIGVLDSKSEITRVVLSLLSPTTGSGKDLLVDKILFQNTSQGPIPVVTSNPILTSPIIVAASVSNPEPGMMSLMALGCLALGWKLRRKRS